MTQERIRFTTNYTDAYYRGYDAFRQAVPRRKNPYKDTENRIDWQTGWDIAQQDSISDRREEPPT